MALDLVANLKERIKKKKKSDDLYQPFHVWKSLEHNSPRFGSTGVENNGRVTFHILVLYMLCSRFSEINLRNPLRGGRV